MKEIIEKLQKQIDEAIECNQPLDEASWGYEQGVIITVNEAKEIIELLSAPKREEFSDVREPVKKFAVAMEETLRKNDHKGGWDKCSVQYLLKQVEIQTIMLKCRVQGALSEDIKSTCKNVANYAMMIFDRLENY